MGRPTISPQRNTIGGAGIVDATITSPKLGASAAGATALPSSVITTAKLGDAAVISPKIGTNAIGATHIASSAISTVKIAATAVISPKIGTSAVGATHLATAAVIGPKLGSSSVGLTQAAAAVQRSLTVVAYGGTPATAHNVVVFRAPGSGATIQNAYWGPGTAQGHAVNEADTWILSLVNAKTGLSLNKNACSLSNQTLAATAFKSIPVNNGNSTVLSGHMLRLQVTISGAPAALKYPTAIVEWVPQTNA